MKAADRDDPPLSSSSSPGSGSSESGNENEHRRRLWIAAGGTRRRSSSCRSVPVLVVLLLGVLASSPGGGTAAALAFSPKEAATREPATQQRRGRRLAAIPAGDGRKLVVEEGGASAGAAARDDGGARMTLLDRRAFISRTAAAVVLASMAPAAPADAATAAAPATSAVPVVPNAAGLSPAASPPVLPPLLLPKQFEKVDDVPKSYFAERKYIYAFVERVLDGDTARVRHLPAYKLNRIFGGNKLSPIEKRGISKETLSIRIYGVDAPEVAKRGLPAQPFAEEAKRYATEMLLHSVVKITFLRKDQYSRAVCAVQTLPKSKLLSWIRVPGFGSKDLSLELASAGLAELYTGGGAEYYDNREEIERRILRAKRQKRGIWSLGDQRTSAAEFKRNNKKNPQQPKQKKLQPVPAVAARSTSRGGVGVGVTKTGTKLASSGGGAKKNGKKQQQRQQQRGSNVLEAVVTGLEVVAG